MTAWFFSIEILDGKNNLLRREAGIFPLDIQDDLMAKLDEFLDDPRKVRDYIYRKYVTPNGGEYAHFVAFNRV